VKKMTNFTPVRLSSDADDPRYLQAIKAVRLWAGPHVYLGDAGLLAPERDGLLPLFDLLENRALDLGVCVSDLAGSTMNYTATIPEGEAFSGSLRMTMRVDSAGAIWVTAMSIVGPIAQLVPDTERETPGHIQIARSKWEFQLSQNAHTLVVAMLLNERGVVQFTDTDRLIEEIERAAQKSRTHPFNVDVL